MNPDLSVYESHAITEQVETMLSQRFAIYDIDIHVEPAAIPEDEVFGNVTRKLFRNEKIILSKIPGYEEYIAKDFIMIDEKGDYYTRDEFFEREVFHPCNFTDFTIQSISQKTKLITYALDGAHHTSLWRRHEKWFLIFHQITPKQ